MAESSSSNRTGTNEPRQFQADRIRQGIEQTLPSLPAEEIESLLEAARESSRRRSQSSRDEELGPGDVQHFRGNSMKRISLENAQKSTVDSLDRSSSPESTLNTAEQHLAEAIADTITDTRVNNQQAGHSLPQVATNTRSSSAETSRRGNLTLEDLSDLELDISIELGRAQMTIEDVTKLREGSVVSLDKFAGDPVDIVANGRLVARGELIVVRGKFGVRLSEVL